ncbi:hypothetical protein Naga_100167g17 [Nannochloropsis gaditana]|uniref:Uncharacterized protein n=1 Tax=Nannochloropsis gaditana TaxID=72520 RepID=W7TH41_9STRA|nr:hypothetical protein Naga_100167g17 [Nannochloropsis gaditana]
MCYIIIRQKDWRRPVSLVVFDLSLVILHHHVILIFASNWNIQTKYRKHLSDSTKLPNQPLQKTALSRMLQFSHI